MMSYLHHEVFYESCCSHAAIHVYLKEEVGRNLTISTVFSVFSEGGEKMSKMATNDGNCNNKVLQLN